MANLIVAAAAEVEIDEARAYLRRDSAMAADAFLAEVRHVLGLIADAPKQWPRVALEMSATRLL